MTSTSLQRHLARLPADVLTPLIDEMLKCNAGSREIKCGSRRKPWLHVVLQLSDDHGVLITNRLTGHSAQATEAAPRAQLVAELAAGLGRREAILEAARQDVGCPEGPVTEEELQRIRAGLV